MRLLIIFLAASVIHAQLNARCTSDNACRNKAFPCTGNNCICDTEISTCKLRLGQICRAYPDGCQSGALCSAGRCLAGHDQNCTEGACLHRGVCINGKCRAEPGYAWNPVTQSYGPCDPKCATCYFPNDAQSCLSCADEDKVAIDGVCVCLDGAADEDDVCRECDGTCGSCAVPGSAYGCTSCAVDSMTLISGVCACPTETAWSEETKNCEPCDSSCATCSVPGDPNYCTSCNTGTLVNGNCVTDEPEPEPVTCPPGTAPNQNNVCMDCHYSCRTCLIPGNPNRCSSCSRSKRLVGGMCIPFKVKYKKFKRPCPRCPEFMASINGVCKCLRGYIGDSKVPGVSDNYCLPCDESCLTCYEANNPEACTSCYRWMYPLNGRCLPEPVTPIGPEIVCSPVCETCTVANDPDQCTSCAMANSVLSQGKCHCPAGTYNVSNTCTDNCAYPCTECFINDSSICTSCSEGMIPLGGTCVCPNRTALSPIVPLQPSRSGSTQYRCLPCDVSCLTCGEPGNPLACTACADPQATLINGECLCPDAEMQFDGDGICTCPDGTTEDGGTCYGIVCPEGTFLYEGVCAPCEIPNCVACETPDVCAECEVGYYLDDGRCAQCAASCIACTGPDECTACEEGYELVNGRCVEACPPCCTSCTFNDDGPVCTSCIGNYVYINGQCSSCSEGIPHCANCRNCACTRCEAGYYLLDSTTCAPCNSTIPFCKICNGKDTCLQCEEGYRFDPTTRQCVSGITPPPTGECPEGTYKNKLGRCCDCYFNCKGCIGPGKNMCTECYPNAIPVSYTHLTLPTICSV
eukprot:TRINITY_DN5483_c0_g1_i17.p1 TRINITY_DN5483_c0_g1~~TRINITY_DN5483_c0_g1_i17.p1  ORF type:complete len:803 (-),score=134.61 TRINITY_DN5483_c0_g1_i17:46-2454(-)